MRQGSEFPSRTARSGFTFVELMVAMAILVIFAATTFVALTQYNRFATASRLRIHALALAQQEIDEILTVQWRVSAARPAPLAAGTRNEENLVINADALNTQTGLGSIFTPLVTPIRATRTVQITNVSARTVAATVTVSFNFANRPYSVVLSTIRSSDTI
jgi:prepilin-type N-terminal cleavage/methylation domain-containing protein